MNSLQQVLYCDNLLDSYSSHFTGNGLYETAYLLEKEMQSNNDLFRASRSILFGLSRVGYNWSIWCCSHNLRPTSSLPSQLYDFLRSKLPPRPLRIVIPWTNANIPCCSLERNIITVYRLCRTRSVAFTSASFGRGSGWKDAGRVSRNCKLPWV